MTITIINKGTRREQQQNGPCPFVVDSPAGTAQIAAAGAGGWRRRGRFETRTSGFWVRHEYQRFIEQIQEIAT